MPAGSWWGRSWRGSGPGAFPVKPCTQTHPSLPRKAPPPSDAPPSPSDPDSSPASSCRETNTTIFWKFIFKAFFHLRNIAKLRNMLSVSDAFMTSRLDYCNALLGACPASSINKLQIVQHAAARVLTRSRKYDHITPILQSLHWLPIKFRISYKILLLAYKALNDLAPAYLTNLLSRYNPTRSLRNKTLDSW